MVGDVINPVKMCLNFVGRCFELPSAAVSVPTLFFFFFFNQHLTGPRVHFVECADFEDILWGTLDVATSRAQSLLLSLSLHGIIQLQSKFY